ncbi:MAG TPA: hypothetical protein VJX68_17355 [Candidatus Binatus sp.]|uniref:hypothetical protein n=1 Tax=Candidatus Binatus sp. TaxID=2811406 RepID=UPI002B45BE21|nr:hypothetical protein [Candidatus Binatus sp.]HKN14959.1 hypothetical protein [Candidatus Binatus sp.]
MASAHAPSVSPAMVHRVIERPRRDATIAVNGVSARLTMIDVAIRFAGVSWYPIRANPDAMLRMLARVLIGLRGAPLYI